MTTPLFAEITYAPRSGPDLVHARVRSYRVEDGEMRPVVTMESVRASVAVFRVSVLRK